VTPPPPSPYFTIDGIAPVPVVPAFKVARETVSRVGLSAPGILRAAWHNSRYVGFATPPGLWRSVFQVPRVPMPVENTFWINEWGGPRRLTGFVRGITWVDNPSR